MRKPCEHTLPPRAERPAVDVVPYIVGALLLFAAASKLWTDPLTDWTITNYVLSVVVVSVEVGLGLLLVLGLLTRVSFVAAWAWFSITAGISATKGIVGERSCGCFGAAPVSPWLALGLSLAALYGLSYAWPRNSSAGPSRARTRWAALVLILATVGGVAVWQYAPAGRAELTVAGEIVGDARTVELRPEKWLGQRLPLLPYLQTDASLSEGDWIIGFVRIDCSVCEAAVEGYERLAASWPAGHGFPRIIVIDVSRSLEGSQRDSSSSVVRGYLSPSHRWEIPVPIELRIRDGQVSSIRRREQLVF
jgi:hypothetical protein